MVEEIKKYFYMRNRRELIEVNELNADSVEEMTKLLTSSLAATIMDNVGKKTIQRWLFIFYYQKN